MILVLSDEERKAYQKKYRTSSGYKAAQKKYNSKPERKARQKERDSTPEAKARRKEHQSKPEIKAREKERRATPKYKAKFKAYSLTPENKAREKERRATPEHKAYQKEYRDKPEAKAKLKEYQSTPEYKTYRKEYWKRPGVIAKDEDRKAKIRLKVLQYYSKQLSKSDIPCCRCCGENFHIDFLAIDHIAGRRKMDSESELLKLGYSSSLISADLLRWIIKNNFPKGFQILCHKCNLAKGYSKNKNKCPHEKIEKILEV